MDKKLVFIDGECLVCNRFGLFLLRVSPDISLATLGGLTYRALQLPQSLTEVDTLIYWDGTRAFIQAEALREIAVSLGGVWKFLARVSRLLPLPVLNFFYARFAKIRYRIFGKVESCSLIPAKYRSRLIKD